MRNNDQEMVPYDGDLVAITGRYESALNELLEAKLEMLGSQLDPECWKWMCCYVNDLADLKPIAFEAGNEDYRPDYMRGFRTRVFFNTVNPVSYEDRNPTLSDIYRKFHELTVAKDFLAQAVNSVLDSEDGGPTPHSEAISLCRGAMAALMEERAAREGD